MGQESNMTFNKNDFERLNARLEIYKDGAISKKSAGLIYLLSLHKNFYANPMKLKNGLLMVAMIVELMLYT